jgi:hypothetical protein
MPGGNDAVPPVTADTSEMTQALVKIIHNKIRNLRKAIDKASAIEKAGEKGEKLQADQLESIAAKPGKVLVLDELEEILKKQSAVIATYQPSEKSRKRGGKRNFQGANTEVASNSTDVTSVSSASEVLQGNLPANGGSQGAGAKNEGASQADSSNLSSVESTREKVAAVSGGDLATDYADHDVEECNANLANVASTSAPRSAVDLVDSLQKSFADRELAVDLDVAISKVLSLLHVVDFIGAPESKQAVLTFFNCDRGRSVDRVVSAYDLELISYFVVMLTSPNGDVAHAAAVDTSAAHCLSYVQSSSAEAFTGTTYSTLCDIVRAVGESPPLACRGVSSVPSGSVEQSQIAFSGKGSFVAEDSAIAAVGSAVVTPMPTPRHGHGEPVAPRTDRVGGTARGGRGGTRRGPRGRGTTKSRPPGNRV